MKNLKFVIIFLSLLGAIQQLNAQMTINASSNRNYYAMEKNTLFNAGTRYTVMQTGSRQFTVADLFDGYFDTKYVTGFDGTETNAIVLEISGLREFHTQLGTYVGFTSRYHPPKKFKIEGFDTYNGSVWKEIANETTNTAATYTKLVPSGAYSKLRFTLYESTSPTGMMGLGELFFLHAEGARAYDGLTVQYAPNGSVGIGTDNPDPAYKLNVSGKVRAREIKVENANWPDYVFLPSYKVPTLQETEKHIKEKGHLPGIPSASEVKANGVDLGEMNAKLLQKIEELTLHLIEMKKENKVMSERLEKLERKNQAN